MAELIELTGKQLLALDTNKEVSEIVYKDGSADIFFDCDERTLAYIYEYAADRGQNFQEAVLEMLTKGLELLAEQHNDSQERNMYNLTAQIEEGELLTLVDYIEDTSFLIKLKERVESQLEELGYDQQKIIRESQK